MCQKPQNEEEKLDCCPKCGKKREII